ncbi:MAG: hypothetical protein M3007_01465, partial [Candidatus Eremiobacteraeota bacterium]|nr:hypothetical protein [Candidatus Eremiobacteraeota bacterium]
MRSVDARLGKARGQVALAGDHAHIETASWRAVAAALYLCAIAAITIALLIFFPPHFDLKIETVISVIVVAVFLMAMERPVNTPATMVAPLTAISAASAVAFGSWVIVLSVVAWLAVRFHINNGEEKWRNLIKPETIGQICIAINVSYAYLGLWHLAVHFQNLLPSFFHNLLTFVGVVAVGLGGQTVNNLFAYPWYLIKGHPFSISQLFRTGVVASIYAYLLLATYKFGGLLATAIFYMVVAQVRVVQDLLGVTAQLHKLEKA